MVRAHWEIDDNYPNYVAKDFQLEVCPLKIGIMIAVSRVQLRRSQAEA